MHLGDFGWKPCHHEHSKIAQSGHTVHVIKHLPTAPQPTHIYNTRFSFASFAKPIYSRMSEI